MKTFAALFIFGIGLWPLQTVPVRPKPDTAVTKPSEAPKPEPLPELLSARIENLQLRYQAAQHVLEASDAYKTFLAASQELGKAMDALTVAYGKEHGCVVDQLAKTCNKPAKAEK